MESDPHRCWAPEGTRPNVAELVIREYMCIFATVSPHDGIQDLLILPVVNAEAMSVFLAEVAARHPDEFVLSFTDQAGSTKLDISPYLVPQILGQEISMPLRD